MATVQQLKTQIENANTLGRTNLSLKGVKLPETATTHNIMTAIAEISGSGTEYTSIIYNTDNTVTLTDKDGAVHTMSCTYENGKLIGVTYDGKAVDLTYNGDALVKVGKTAVDMGNVPATSGATFNIAYGETPPEDTSKLWIKANEPNNIKIGSSDLSYIESTGTQYIDTGYIANQNTRIECKYQIVGNKGNYDTLFSDFTNIQYSNIYDTRYQLVKWGGQYTTYGSGISSSNITYLTVDNGTFTFTENGVTTTQTIGANTEFASPYSILIFSNRDWQDISKYELASCCKANLYYFKIYEGETLVRYFIPAIDDNGAICLYDNVTKAYFYNQGTGEFVGNIIRSELTQGNIEIKTSLTENKFNLINTDTAQVEIGVENVYIGNENNEAKLCEAYLHNGTEWMVIK